MNFKKYQHIEKLGSSEVNGILNGTVYLFYKIDGTNSCVWLKEDGQLGFGSRKRELSLEEDNANFMKNMIENEEIYTALWKYLRAHPSHIIYGEWLVPHTLKTYNNNAWKKFYIFDIYDTATNLYIDYEYYSYILDKDYPELNYIPLLERLENPSVDDIKERLERTGEFLCSQGLGEGLVIKRYDFKNNYGRTIWAKMLCEDFRKTKQRVRSENREHKDENLVEYNIIKLLTLEHVLKEKYKIQEKYNTEFWESKFTYELLNRTFNEFWRDNWEKILKKFNMPTINFKKLRKMSDDFVKEVLANEN